MIVNCYRHCFFGVLLSDYILVQLGFNLMWCRKIIDIYKRSTLFTFFFLLHFLLFRNHIFQICHVHNLNTRHVHKLTVVDLSAVHCIKTLLHAVVAHTDMIRQFDHLSCYTFRTSADKADFLIIIVGIFLCRFHTGSFHFFYFFFLFFKFIIIILIWHCLFLSISIFVSVLSTYRVWLFPCLPAVQHFKKHLF